MPNETMSLIDFSFNYINSLLSRFITRFIIAVVILLVGFVVGRISGRFVQRFLHEIELDVIMRKATGIKISLEEVIGHLTSYFLYFIFIVIALEKIGIGAIAFNLLAAGVIIIIVLSIFLAIKDFVPNLLAGIFLHRKGFLNEGDTIRVGGTQGKIVHINLVETRIQTKNGDVIYIPNSILTKSEVVKLKRKR